MTNNTTLPPMQRLPYELRLRIGKALDRLVCDDSTPEQVDKFVATFAHFDLTITSTPKDIDGGRFADWSLADIIGQCRMQSREQLDPEFAQLMAELAERFSSLAAPAPSDHAKAAVEACLKIADDYWAAVGEGVADLDHPSDHERGQIVAASAITTKLNELWKSLQTAPSPAERETGL